MSVMNKTSFGVLLDYVRGPSFQRDWKGSSTIATDQEDPVAFGLVFQALEDYGDVDKHVEHKPLLISILTTMLSVDEITSLLPFARNKSSREFLMRMYLMQYIEPPV
ncbi:hypothetical protein H310_01253 [Aphanomyces invadans]|uniref:Uncharacterized protein n=1 Tax=Aphanomyces invadans TaxID=157072 RepID=A0A024UQJ7_9STRA|nr:hypothetical protein H310_01253 [Aphanomyces invadans]ETW08731.1 hypothetical protein H310_01253 [Aphanomyces invadans]|eukprot:XP_008862536.1 hypothetical protein H310_01253 [Aphanomyces invadans]